MAVGVQKAWSTTAASNDAADTNINFAEGQTPASLNNSMRAEMAALKGFANQILGAKTTGGSANAQTYTSDSVAAISTAYGAGMGFVFVAGYTNTGACTLNVDGVGAVAIRKGGAATALAANDIVAGGVYFVVYNGTYWILLNPESGSVSAQPLDATLTALAALSWSSLTPVVQFTAADTISLTSAPKVTTIELGDATDTTLSRSSAGVAAIEGDPIMTRGSTESISGLKTFTGASTSIISNQPILQFYENDAGSNEKRFWLTLDGGALKFQYLTDGATGPVNALTMTRSGTTPLLAAFGSPVQARVPLSSETSGTLTSASANKKVACSGDVTLDDGVFTTDDFILFDPGTSNRTFTRAAGLTMYVNGTNSASATLAANQMGCAHWRSSTVVVLTGAFS